MGECPTPAPTEPPQCQPDCYADTQPWRYKCGWEMGGDPVLKEKCKKCPECPPTPISCADGPFSGVTFGRPGEFWFHDYCGRTHTPTAAPTPMPPTPAPTTAAPAPTPPSPNCLSWCAVDTKPWSEKCAWGENCNECNSCQAPVVEPPHCRNECYENTLSWKKKCGQEMGGDITLAEKCKKCPECPLFPSSCAKPKAQWGNRWPTPPTDYCGGTRAPTAAPTPAPPTLAPTLAPPAPAPTVYSIALCPDYAPGCARAMRHLHLLGIR